MRLVLFAPSIIIDLIVSASQSCIAKYSDSNAVAAAQMGSKAELPWGEVGLCCTVLCYDKNITDIGVLAR